MGSCKSSAKLPFWVASQPIMASRGSGSTWLYIVGEQVKVPFGSKGFWAPMKPPFNAKPKRQLTCRRQTSILPEGCVFALTFTEAAPTPCSRTGFHIRSISL